MKSEFYLKNLNISLSQTFKLQKFEVQINSIDNHIQKVEEFNYERNPVLETGVLKIQGKGDRDEYLDMAKTIKNLLSFALGRNIIFDRQVYTINNEESTDYKKMSDPVNEGIPIIPKFNLSNYLIQTIPRWQLLSKEEKNAIFVAINYLNQTKNSFIEDRVLKVTQAWESLAEFWKIESDLDERLQLLKTKLMDAYKNWRKENDVSDLDSSGEIGSKISSTIDQEKLLSKLEGVASKFRLNISKLNLRFRELKSLRDQVAHTGRINIIGREAYPILEAAITGLQIILLDHLGYDGLIIFNKDGRRTYEKMEEFKTEHNI